MECADFESARSVLEFDILVIDWSGYIESLHRAIETNGFRYFREEKKNEVSRALLNRFKSIGEFRRHDRLVVFIAKSINANFSYLTNQGYLEDAELQQYIPPRLLGTEVVNGSMVEESQNAPRPLKEFAQKVKDHVSYSTALATNNVAPIMTIKGTKKAVSIWETSKDIHPVLYTPPPFQSVADENLFAEALCALSDQLHAKQHDVPPLPDWHADYQSKDESDLLLHLDHLACQLASLQNEIESANIRLDEVLFLKRLFTDQGESLLEAASKAFQFLGFEVAPGPEGRDDLILIDQSKRTYVVEVKGKDSKGAAEADAAQLEKWVSDHLLKSAIKPKGVLVVNGYRQTPLQMRKESVFPHQMLDYSSRREQCLISGYQLLSFVLAMQQKKISIQDAQEQLFRSNGICPHFESVGECLALLHRAPK